VPNRSTAREPVDGALQTSPADRSHLARANQSRELPPLLVGQAARDEVDVVEPDKAIRIEMMRNAMDRGEDERVDAGQAAGRRVERRNRHRSTRELVIGQHVRERQGVEDLPVHVDRMYQPTAAPLLECRLRGDELAWDREAGFVAEIEHDAPMRAAARADRCPASGAEMAVRSGCTRGVRPSAEAAVHRRAPALSTAASAPPLARDP
jgi:hypothetical protein